MSYLIQRYPEFLQHGAEFADIQQALEPERLALWQAQDSLCDQLNVDTATWGLKSWEEALGIPVEVTKDIAFRRSRVKSKLRGAGVTTVAMIQSVAESFSNGDVEVTEQAERYRVAIKFVGTIGIPPNMDDLTAALREIMPAHLSVTYLYTYTVWQEVAAITWDSVKAGTWGELRTRQTV